MSEINIRFANLFNQPFYIPTNTSFVPTELLEKELEKHIKQLLISARR